MDAYIFQADIYCADCANAIKRALSHTPCSERLGDSRYWPQGPFSHGGGEADSPQHCGNCGTFLENRLTEDGEAYVTEQLAPYQSKDDRGLGFTLRAEAMAKRADQNRRWVLAEWARFYTYLFGEH